MARILTELQALCDVTGLLLGYSFNRGTQKGSPELSLHVNTYGCLPYTTASTNQGRIIIEAEVWKPE